MKYVSAFCTVLLIICASTSVRAEEYGRVEVVTNYDATVEIDGKEFSDWEEKSLKLPIGYHRIRISSSGYKTVEAGFYVEENEIASINIRLVSEKRSGSSTDVNLTKAGDVHVGAAVRFGLPIRLDTSDSMAATMGVGFYVAVQAHEGLRLNLDMILVTELDKVLPGLEFLIGFQGEATKGFWLGATFLARWNPGYEESLHPSTGTLGGYAVAAWPLGPGNEVVMMLLIGAEDVVHSDTRVTVDADGLVSAERAGYTSLNFGFLVEVKL